MGATFFLAFRVNYLPPWMKSWVRACQCTVRLKVYGNLKSILIYDIKWNNRLCLQPLDMGKELITRLKLKLSNNLIISNLSLQSDVKSTLIFRTMIFLLGRIAKVEELLEGIIWGQWSVHLMLLECKNICILSFTKCIFTYLKDCIFKSNRGI